MTIMAHGSGLERRLRLPTLTFPKKHIPMLFHSCAEFGVWDEKVTSNSVIRPNEDQGKKSALAKGSLIFLRKGWEFPNPENVLVIYRKTGPRAERVRVIAGMKPQCYWPHLDGRDPVLHERHVHVLVVLNDRPSPSVVRVHPSGV